MRARPFIVFLKAEIVVGVLSVIVLLPIALVKRDRPDVSLLLHILRTQNALLVIVVCQILSYLNFIQLVK